jgi:hypothetical protein
VKFGVARSDISVESIVIKEAALEPVSGKTTGSQALSRVFLILLSLLLSISLFFQSLARRGKDFRSLEKALWRCVFRLGGIA